MIISLLQKVSTIERSQFF